MIRLALPKSRNLESAREALSAAGLPLSDLDTADRSLRVRIEGSGSVLGEELEVLMLKDIDLPLYVLHGVADLGVVGSDVLAEMDGDLLVPARLAAGRCRLSLIGRAGSMPRPGSQVRLATKYPRIARQMVAHRPWGAEIVRLSGSIELAPLLDLADLALDIVQTGRTLRDNGLVELEVIEEVAPSLVVNRASFQRHRPALNQLFDRLEAAGMVGP
jgi:ATP phosphoribosyltransferase